jgi:hydroxyethylthiazole kinase-like uncharacterized protein yjeF
MLLGLGVDLIEKERFRGMLAKPGIRRRFAPAELVYAEQFNGTGRANEALASAFAAKEAFYKAASRLLPYDTKEMFWQAELRRDEDGAPKIIVNEPWAAHLSEVGVRKIHVSISHDRAQVLAAVVLLDNDGDVEEIAAGLTPEGFSPLTFTNAEAVEKKIISVDMALAASWLPLRSSNAHKGDFGHVFVQGGAKNYIGAVQMAAEGALRAGAGLVSMCPLADVRPISPEIMCLSLSDEQGGLDEAALKKLNEKLESNVLAFGMGLGRSQYALKLTETASALPNKKVIDADGLFALAQLKICPRRAILTPHSGEMARLLGCAVADVEADRPTAVRRCAEEYQSVVVLKGQRTLTTAPGMPIYLNTTGNPGMATGGSGDVLAGITAAWLAQGMEPLRAAVFAVYLHGLAGDLAAAEKTQYAMTALDIVHYLPTAYRQLLAVKQAKNDEKCVK